MKRAILILFVLLLLFISGCFKEIPTDDLKACNSDNACIMVYDIGCCKCPLAINKQYQDYWQKLDAKTKEDCTNIVCSPCIPPPFEAKCENNMCILVSSLTET